MLFAHQGRLNHKLKPAARLSSRSRFATRTTCAWNEGTFAAGGTRPKLGGGGIIYSPCPRGNNRLIPSVELVVPNDAQFLEALLHCDTVRPRILPIDGSEQPF